MARQLAMRTVVAWFGNLSFDDQRDALEQMRNEHDHSRSARRSELEKQLADLGFGARKTRGRPKGVRNGNGTARLNGTKSSVQIKYRDPKTSETWSGRGRMARWLKTKQDGGEKIEKYLV